MQHIVQSGKVYVIIQSIRLNINELLRRNIMKKVTAVLLVKDNLILIAKKKASDPSINKWEFPGGKIEEGDWRNFMTSSQQ